MSLNYQGHEVNSSMLRVTIPTCYVNMDCNFRSGTLCGVTSLKQAKRVENCCAAVAANVSRKLQVHESSTDLDGPVQMWLLLVLD